MKKVSLLLIFLIISILYNSCVTRDAEYYEKKFKKDELIYSSLNNYLINKYAIDTKFSKEVRLIFINSKIEKKALKVEIIDNSIQEML